MSPLWLLPVLAAGSPGEVAGRALEAFVAGDVDGAYPLLVEASAAASADVPPEVWLFRGAVERERGAWDDAAATFRAGSEVHPDARALWLELGTTASWQHAWPQALDAYDAALLLDPDDPTARTARARTLWWSGRRDAGLRAVGTVLDDVPAHPEATELQAAIRADRPRTLTVLGGLRTGDGAAALGGVEGTLRRGPWTGYGAVERAAGVGNATEASATWAARAGVAARLGSTLVVDGGSRSWWSPDGAVHAGAARATATVGWFQPHVGLLAGQLDPVLDMGVRVGREGLWTSATAYRSLPRGLDPTTTVAVAMGGARGPLDMRFDGAWADLAQGPLWQGGLGLTWRLDQTWALGARVSTTQGWLSRVDGVATCTMSF